MSLIREALKRREEDGEPPYDPMVTPHVVPPRMPPPEPIPPRVPLPALATQRPAVPRKKKTRAWVVVLTAALVVVIVAGAALAIFAVAYRVFSEKGIPVITVTPSPAEPGSGGGAVSPPATRVLSLPRPSPAREAEARGRAVSQGASTIELAVVRAPSAPESPARADAVTPAPAKKPAEPQVIRVDVVAAAPVSSESGWPSLKVHGVLAQSASSRGAAIINGKVVEIGETVQGARLMEVNQAGALLGYQGKTQFVRVGQGTL